MDTSLAIIVRSTEIGATWRKFDKKNFHEHTEEHLKTFLGDHPIIVLTNVEEGHPLAEISAKDGRPPTHRAIEEAFPDAVADGRITLMTCDDWGANAGSAPALNMGAQYAIQTWGSDMIFNWSHELLAGHDLLNQARDFLERKNLDVVGFLREGWEEKLQWKVPQNTGALWRSDFLERYDFFSRRTSGDSGEMLTLPKYGKVPLAGMEDFELMLRAYKTEGTLKWGMVGRKNLPKWHRAFTGLRLENHLKKVARQADVMHEYARWHFPDREPAEIITEILMLHVHEDGTHVSK